MRFFLNKRIYQFTALPIRAGHSSFGVHQGGQGGETYGPKQGYKNPPVPRRLVAESPFTGDWLTTHPDFVEPLPQTGLASEHEKVRVNSSTGLHLRRLPFRPVDRSGVTNSRKMGKFASEAFVLKDSGELYGQVVHVLDRTLDSHRETSVVRSSSHETHSLASEETLARSRSFREGHSPTSLPSPPPGLVAGRGKCSHGSTLASVKSRPSAVYRRIKRRLGRTLRGFYGKRSLVRRRELPTYKLLGTKGGLPGPQEFRATLQKLDCVDSDGQHYCGRLYQQTGRYEIRLSLCPPMETGRLNVIADKLSRHNQVIQTEWSLDQRVFNLLCSRWAPPQVDLFATTRYNYKLPKFVSLVPDPTAWAVDALSLPWQNLDVYAFPPVSFLNQVISKVVNQGCLRMILIAPGWPNMPWFWDLVNLSVQIPFSLPLKKDLVTQPFNGLPHRDLSNLNLHAWLLEPPSFKDKGSLARWQHELRLLRDSQPDQFTSQSGPFLSSGVSQTRWTSGRPL